MVSSRRGQSSGLVSCRSCPRALRAHAPRRRLGPLTEASRGARQGSGQLLATRPGPSSRPRCRFPRRPSHAASTGPTSHPERPFGQTPHSHPRRPPRRCHLERAVGHVARPDLRRRRQGLRPLRRKARGARGRYRPRHRQPDPRCLPDRGSRSAGQQLERRFRTRVRVTDREPRDSSVLHPMLGHRFGRLPLARPPRAPRAPPARPPSAGRVLTPASPTRCRFLRPVVLPCVRALLAAA
jgi:hypothetical protein